MGREIRRVPPNWVHPKDENGVFIPLLDQTYEQALLEWNTNNNLWLKGEHPSQSEFPAQTSNLTYAQWSDEPPVPQRYRPDYPDEPTHYQVYETITEGTPVTPVFRTPKELADHLVNTGQATPEEASAFIKDGYATSFFWDPQIRRLQRSYQPAPGP